MTGAYLVCSKVSAASAVQGEGDSDGALVAPYAQHATCHACRVDFPNVSLHMPLVCSPDSEGL